MLNNQTEHIDIYSNSLLYDLFYLLDKDNDETISVQNFIDFFQNNGI